MATKKTQLNNRALEQIELREKDIALFIRNLEKFLGANVRKILKGLKVTDTNALEAANVLGGIFDQLRAAGLEQEIAKITSTYARELASIKRNLNERSGKEVLFSDADRALVENLIAFDIERVATTSHLFVDDLKARLIRGVVSGRLIDPEEIQAAALEGRLGNLETELNTGIQGFNRSMNLRKAEDVGLDKFLYAGPLDEVTREFCAEKVGGIFTSAEIASWDNGQDLPANIYLGGYNCRHRLEPVDDATAEEIGGGD